MKVDALISSGETIRSVAALANVDRFAVARHRKHAFPQPEPEPELSELELSDKRLAALSDQLEAQYAAALAVSDQKLAVEVLKTRSRIEAERHKRIVTRKQAEVDDASDPEQMWPTPKMADNVLQKVRNAYAKHISNGFVWCPLGCGRPVDPKTIQAYMESQNDSSAAN